DPSPSLVDRLAAGAVSDLPGDQLGDFRRRCETAPHDRVTRGDPGTGYDAPDRAAALPAARGARDHGCFRDRSAAVLDSSPGPIRRARRAVYRRVTLRA